MPVCSNLSAMSTFIYSLTKSFTTEDTEERRDLNHRDTESHRRLTRRRKAATSRGLPLQAARVKRLVFLYFYFLRASVPLWFIRLFRDLRGCLFRQITWINNPSLSFGSNHVDLGGMIAPASDTAIK